MMDIAAGVKFENISNEFLDKLAKDVKDIKKMDKVLIPADKTSNLYKMLPNQYSALLDKAVQKDYKKDREDLVNKVVREEREITSKLEINDRVEKLTLKERL